MAPPLSDGVAERPPSGVTAFFQDLDILYECLRSGKTTRPWRTKFLLSQPMTFCESILSESNHELK